MNEVTHDEKMGTGAFGLGRTMKFYLDGKEIGYWFCEGPLRSEYGVFHPNKYLKGLLGEKAYTGGDWANTHRVLQSRVKELKP
jgi:hypothetical protein